MFLWIHELILNCLICWHIIVQNSLLRELPGGPLVRTLYWTGFLSFIRELRSHKPHSIAKRKVFYDLCISVIFVVKFRLSLLVVSSLFLLVCMVKDLHISFIFSKTRFSLIVCHFNLHFIYFCSDLCYFLPFTNLRLSLFFF